MSDTPHEKTRPLTEREKALTLALLGSRSDNLSRRLDGASVHDMADGGMGSIRFLSSNREQTAKLGKTVAEAQYIDSDGVAVQIAVNLDEDGELFELDFWKVDFSALRAYPDPNQLKIK
jgi:hypothetical protein